MMPGMQRGHRSQQPSLQLLKLCCNALCRTDSLVNTEKDEDPTTHEVKYTTQVGNLEEAGGKSLLMNASPQLAQDVRAAFAAVPRVKPTWTDRHLKIMVVGESGLGK